MKVLSEIKEIVENHISEYGGIINRELLNSLDKWKELKEALDDAFSLSLDNDEEFMKIINREYEHGWFMAQIRPVIADLEGARPEQIKELCKYKKGGSPSITLNFKFEPSLEARENQKKQLEKQTVAQILEKPNK